MLYRNGFISIVLLLISSTLLAETLSGRVTDGAVPVAMVEITLIGADNNVIAETARTDRNGIYRLLVGRGRYKLRASKVEFTDVWVKDISVGGKDLTVDIIMTPAVFDDETYVAPSDGCD